MRAKTSVRCPPRPWGLFAVCVWLALPRSLAYRVLKAIGYDPTRPPDALVSR